MSRTTRKVRWYCEHNEVSFINWYTRWDKDYEYIRVRRPAETIRAEQEAAQSKYYAEVKANGGTDFLYMRKSIWSGIEYPEYIRKDYVRTHDRVKVPRTKQYFEDVARKEYHSLTRDGTHKETTRRTGFKKQSAKIVRNANKRFCNLVLKDEWDEVPQPNGKEGDTHRWSWW